MPKDDFGLTPMQKILSGLAAIVWLVLVIGILYSI